MSKPKALVKESLSPEETSARLDELAVRIRACYMEMKLAPRRRHRSGDGYVYFVQMGDDGPIKIGYSKDFLQRVYDLQVGSPYELKILFAMNGFPETELRLHAKFRANHLRGEWFRSCGEIYAFIQENLQYAEYVRPVNPIIEEIAVNHE